MHCIISLERNHPNAFAVCLMEVPFFPLPPGQKKVCIKEGVTRYAVIAANDDGGKWGYVTLTKEWKETIGEAMLNLGCQEERWYWCEFYESTKEKEDEGQGGGEDPKGIVA